MNINYADSCNFKPIPAITPLDSYWQNGTWKFNMSEITAGAASQPSWIDIILKGNTALTLVNSKADGLNYLKLFGGTEQLPETYLDTVTLSGGCEQRNLPDNYIQRQYIYMVENSYLLPGITPEPDWHIEMDFQTTSVSTASVRDYFGGRYNDSSAGAGIRLAHTSSGKVVMYGFDTNNAYTGSIYNIANNTRYKYVYNNNSASLSTGGTVVESTTFTPNDTTTSAVGINTYRGPSGSYSSTTEGIYLYSFKAWNGQGELVIDLVPAVQKGTVPVVGFYDTVSKTFMTATTGTFMAGAEAVPSPDTPMDIISNNGVLKFGENILDGLNLGQGTYVSSSTTRIWQEFGKLNGKYKITITGNFEFIVQYRDTPRSGSSPTTSGNIGTWVTSEEYVLDNPNYYYGIAIRYPNSANIVPSNFNGTLSLEPLFIYTDGTQEVVTDSLGNTANAERLLAVGDYKDTQEVLSGSVTRNISIKVLDGTEDWETTAQSTVYRWLSPVLFRLPNIGICSHYVGVNTENTIASMPDMSVKIGSSTSSYLYIKDSSYSNNLSGFKQFLAQQYAQGTPVIVVYPTSSATTETVTPQLLLKSPVTQTAGAISNLGIAETSSSHTTPTPQQPLPINCNNGVVKVNAQGQVYADGTTETVEVTGKNLISTASQYVLLGQYTDTSGNVINSSVNFQTIKFPCQPNTTYTASISQSVYMLRVCVYNSSGTFVQRYNTQLNSSVKTITFTTGASVTQFNIGAQINNTNTTQAMIDNINWQIEQGSTATTYEPYYYGGSATAERLLKVGSYQDVQSVIDGQVTRNVGVKVLDGTESWTYEPGVAVTRFTTSISDFTSIGIRLTPMYCTHLDCISDGRALANVPDNVIYSGDTVTTPNNIYIKATAYTSEAMFKQWLSDQYNAGTPVIVVYPLATATTETVESQALTIQAGTNIVEITQASIDNLELEVSYKAGVTVTITEIENAQLDNSVEVTING